MRFQMFFDYCYFECDSPDDLMAKVRLGTKLVDTALKKFEVNKLERVGIAQFWIAADARSFQDLVLACDTKFHVPLDRIPAFDDCKLSDTAYIVSAAERDSKLVWTVQVGLMTRSEFWGKFAA